MNVPETEKIEDRTMKGSNLQQDGDRERGTPDFTNLIHKNVSAHCAVSRSKMIPSESPFTEEAGKTQLQLNQPLPDNVKKPSTSNKLGNQYDENDKLSPSDSSHYKDNSSPTDTK